MPKRKYIKIPLKDFIKSWETAKTVKEVADKYKATINSVSSKASYLRLRRKIPLKYFRRGPRTDYKNLRKFCLSLKTKN